MKNKNADYQELICTIPGGICRILCDACFTIAYANQTFYQIMGYTPEQAAQEGFGSLETSTYVRDFPGMREILNEAVEKHQETVQFEVRQVNRQGQIFWVLAVCKVNEAEPRTITCIMLDIDERKKVEEALRISEEEYRIALQRHTEKVIIRYDIGKRRLIRPSWAARDLKLPEVMENVPYSMVEGGHIAVESVTKYIRFYEDMMKGIPHGSCIIKLGDERWYRVDYTLVYDEYGNPQRAIISYEDITDQHERAFAYEKWRSHNEMLLESSIGYYECNLTKDVFERIEGMIAEMLPEEDRQSFSGATRYAARHFVYPADRQQYLRLFSREALLSQYYVGKREITAEYRRMAPSGEVFWAETTIQLLPDPYSEDIKGLVLMRDIDVQKREEAELQKRSQVDPLTGLLNRATLTESIDRILAESGDGHHAFIMIDLDHFKEINDTLGHLFGDQILCETAQRLTSATRQGDLVGRLGGDEFVVFLRDCQPEAGLQSRAAALCSALFSDLEGGATVSGSVGVAVFPEDGGNFTELYQNADTALYRAKRYGRNQYVFYSAEERGQSGERRRETPPRKKSGSPRADAVRCRFVLDQTGAAVVEWNTDYEEPFISARVGWFTFSTHIESEPTPDFLQEADVYPEDWNWACPMLESWKNGRAEAQATLRLRLNSGAYLWCDVTLRSFYGKDGAINRCIVIVRDVDAAVRERQQQLQRDRCDALTGYANFDRFRQDCDTLLKGRGKRQYALWYCDLKHFKFINDIFGYETGDRILQSWAKYIAGGLREGETFARRDADHFIVLRLYEGEEAAAAQFAGEARWLEDCAELAGKKFQVEMAAGVYRIEKDEDLLGLDEMLNRASIAQRQAKERGGSGCVFYTEEMRCRVISEKAIEADMHSALREREFCVYLQPQVWIQEGVRLAAAEALVRWKRPDGRIICPNDFIPLFERNGFIVELDRFIFETVCRYLRRRLDTGGRMFKIAVNVSRLSALQKDFAQRYIEIKERYRIPAEFLELEFTETVVVENVQRLDGVMRRMRRRGFSFSLDDFGSGYSSLNMLKDIIVEVLKLDMMFFRNGLNPQRDEAIIASVIAMARALNMRIVAEGVETDEQLQRLRALGCDIVQGYYFGRPVAAESFEAAYKNLLFAADTSSKS